MRISVGEMPVWGKMGRELVKARSVSDFHANLPLSEGGRQSWVDDPWTVQSKEASGRLLGSPSAKIPCVSGTGLPSQPPHAQSLTRGSLWEASRWTDFRTQGLRVCESCSRLGSFVSNSSNLRCSSVSSPPPPSWHFKKIPASYFA